VIGVGSHYKCDLIRRNIKLAGIQIPASGIFYVVYT
jgi:hypothetical protein